MMVLGRYDMSVIRIAGLLLRSVACDRAELAAKNLALPQKLAVLQ